MDPTDPRQDLAKLQQAAQGGAVGDIAPTKDYLNESVEVPKGSMPLGIDDVTQFAALAGITLERKQKTGSAGQLKGKDSISKNPAGTTKNPTRDKLVGEDGFGDAVKQGFNNYNTPGAVNPDFSGDPKAAGGAPTKQKSQEPAKVGGGVTGQQLGKQLQISDPTVFNLAIMKVKQGQELNRQQHLVLSEAFQKLMAMDPQQTQKVMMLLKRMEAKPTEAIKKELPKARDPNWRDMEALRKSGAAGSHKDKKRDMKMGKEKHKKDLASFESIKDMLYARLSGK